MFALLLEMFNWSFLANGTTAKRKHMHCANLLDKSYFLNERTSSKHKTYLRKLSKTLLEATDGIYNMRIW